MFNNRFSYLTQYEFLNLSSKTPAPEATSSHVLVIKGFINHNYSIVCTKFRVILL